MAVESRDRRIDLFRGLALLMIFIDHVPSNAVSAVTLQAFAICDAAEVFVLLAGLSAGMAFARPYTQAGWGAATARVLMRCGQLYITHILVFCIVSAIVISAVRHFDNPAYFEHINILPLFADTERALVYALTLRYLPDFLDILPLYIALLLLLPLMLPMALRCPLLLLGLSASIYGVVQIVPVNLPNYPGDSGWFFNPLAWQFLFVIGLVLGAQRKQGWIVPAKVSHCLAMAATPVIVIAIVIAAPWRSLPGLSDLVIIPWSALPPMSKTDLSVLRLINILALLCLVGAVLRPDSKVLSTPASRIVILLGTHALPVFAAGVICSMLGWVIFFEAGRGIVPHLIVNLGGSLVLVGVAQCARWLGTEPWRTPINPREHGLSLGTRGLLRDSLER